MTIATLSNRAGIPLKYANRHGLITGQTGTGKTVSLMRLAESFSSQGVPVFISDVKGDIGALSRTCPAFFYDLFGDTGNRISVTVGAMGPDLMARALELSDTQAGCLEIAFRFADDTRLPLDTIDDLRAVLSTMSASTSASAVRRYGNATPASIGVITRALLRLETQGGKEFFRAPPFDVATLINSPGKVSILDSVRLIESPRLYSAFLLYMLSDLYARLPEVGDLDKPKLVFFFDEAHLLFTDCPAALLRRIEQTVRLIRSKGVGVYFVSQRPDDVPELVRSQLAHIITHDRALPVGTARFTTMDSNGRPLPAATVKVSLPSCPLGALAETEKPAVAPVVQDVQAAAHGQFDRAGYIFLATMAALSIGCIWLAWSIYAAGKVGAAVAIAIGVWLAIRKRI